MLKLLFHEEAFWLMNISNEKQKEPVFDLLHLLSHDGEKQDFEVFFLNIIFNNCSIVQKTKNKNTAGLTPSPQTIASR